MDELPRQRGGWVKSEVLRRIRREHISAALEDLKSGIVHEFGASTEYDLLHDGVAYPPKAVLGVAARHALGQMLQPGDFSGGQESTCFQVLRDRGFTVRSEADGGRGRSALENLDLPGQSRQVRSRRVPARRLSASRLDIAPAAEFPAPGDTVYLWRSRGKQKEVAGILARATVLSEPWFGPGGSSRRLLLARPA